MERTFIYSAIHPTDRDSIEKKKLLECEGLVMDIANHSIKETRRIECKELIIDIPPELEASRWPDQCCIYRVPKRLREVNNMAYTPRLVSIGPFHHRSEELKDMDIQKLIYLRDFCNRTGKSIEDLKCIIRPKEMEIRSCYSETFLLSMEGFLNMILLDAIFILELFRRNFEKNFENSKAHEEDSENSKAREEDSENSKAREKDSENSKAHYQIDYILNRPCMDVSIRHDLLLLENQLPFFVLEELYGHFYQHVEPNAEEKSLLWLSCLFFRHLDNGWKQHRPSQNPSPSSPEPKNDEVLNHIRYLVNRFPQDRSSPKHFTDLVRYFFCPPKHFPKPKCPTCTGCSPENKNLYCTATKLDEAGLKFTKPDPDTGNLLHIKLRDNYYLETFPCFNLSWLLSCLPFLKSDCLERRVQRCLEVPPLCVDDNTEGLFRNLMALEQCHYPDKTFVCHYIVLLDDLIKTKEDVMLLVENKIIDNYLGSSAAVTKLFNNLGLEIALPPNYHYDKLCEKLNDYVNNPWNRLVGTLTKVYFSDFFKGTATVAGIIVLFVTLWNFISKLLGKA